MAENDLDADYWEARYRDGRTGWDRGQVNPCLIEWLESGELKPCGILIPGSGRGYEVIELASRGFAVTAIDYAPTPLAQLGSRLGDLGERVDLVQADVLTFDPKDPQAAIYEQTCLCALHPDWWADYEQQLYRWLLPGGKLFACFMQTPMKSGPPFHCDIASMKNLFDDSRWIWPQELGEVSHPTGASELTGILIRTGNDSVVESNAS